jgi:hypothetical protein
MDIEEYENKKSVIEHDYNRRLKALAMDYAFSNSSVIAGDIVTDHIGSVLVDHVKFSMSSLSGEPTCVYYGVELTKKMQPKKAGKVRGVLQGNLLESNS